ALVRQADRVFGTRPFAHYDFLLALSDQFSRIGLEHHQSSENGTFPDYLSGGAPFTDNYLLPHEYAHSWNGKSLRPEKLWTPHYNTPMHNELLWMYEGQTEFWAWVLAARAGLYTPPQAQEVLAANAALFEHRVGRRWRDLQDTVYQGIIEFNDAPQAWPSWQRGYDFYDEGTLLWLDVDMKLRELSRDKRSLDNFARNFFGAGTSTGKMGVQTYDFDAVVTALQAVQAHDWAGFLRARIDSLGPGAPLQGLERAGWVLVYNDAPNAAITDMEGSQQLDDFSYSLGLKIASTGGKVNEVLWESPAFRAGLAKDMQVLAIDGMVYNADHMPPWTLPDNKTQWGMLSRSSKQGTDKNANALRFEDLKGKEEVWLHAEKNQRIEVENDETHWVGHDRAKTVDNDENVHIKRDRTEIVDRNETITVKGDRTEKVEKNEKIDITVNRTETVGGNEKVDITGKRDITVGGNETGDTKGSTTMKVGTSYKMEAGTEILLKTGAASLTMKMDGTIELKGVNVTVNGAKIEIAGMGLVDIKAPLVKINS
ncbi:MAG TPA: hypothetical protein PK359_03435, partial [Burkholderiaceae bacterium]|nr:hypothetical protein [Burkholderiaceae bacterium]